MVVDSTLLSFTADCINAFSLLAKKTRLNGMALSATYFKLISLLKCLFQMQAFTVTSLKEKL